MLNVAAAILISVLLIWFIVFASFFRLSIFLAGAAAFLAYFIVNIGTYTVGLFASFDTSQSILTATHVAFALLMLAFLAINRRKLLLPRVHSADIFAVAALLIVFATVFVPFSTGGSLQKIAVLSTAEDNSVHFSIFNSISHEKRLLYKDNPDAIGLIDGGANTYPPGVHLNMAASTTIVFGNNPTLQDLIRSFTVQAIAFYSLFSSLLIYIIAFAILKKHKTITNHILTIAVGTIIIYFSCLGTFLELFVFGFQSQIVAYIIFLTLLSILMYTPLQSSVRSKYLSLAFLLGGLIASTFTWFFISPVLFGVLLVWLYNERAFIKTRFTSSALLAIIAFLFIITPILFYLRDFSPLDQVLLNGGIHTAQNPGLLIAAFLAVVFFITLGITKKKNMTTEHIYILSSILIGLLFLLFLYAYSYVQTGQISYYFYKSQYNLSLFTLTSIGLSFRILSENISFNFKNIHQVLLSSALAIFLIILCFIVKPQLSTTTYLAGVYVGSVDTSQIKMVFDKPEIKDIIIKPACYSISNYMTQKWLTALLLSGSVARIDLQLDHLSAKDFSPLPQRYNDYMKKNSGTLMIDNDYCEDYFLEQSNQPKSKANN